MREHEEFIFFTVPAILIYMMMLLFLEIVFSDGEIDLGRMLRVVIFTIACFAIPIVLYKGAKFILRLLLYPIITILISVGGIIMLALVGILSHEVLSMWWMGSDLGSLSDIVRNLIWSIGGVGAAIGLWLARERQKISSDQVQVQVDQGFNDRLGRGVELLTKEDMIMYCAGIRVLIDLANNATDAQKPIVANIIYDFFRDKTSIRRNKKNQRTPIPKEEVGQDVQNVLDFLVSVSANDREKLYSNWLIDGRLNFRGLDFSHLDFSDKMLEKIDFSGCYIDEATFNKANIEDILMSSVKINNSYFDNTKIFDSDFSHAIIVNSNFTFAEIEETNFSNIEIIDVNFWCTNFRSGEFSGKSKAKFLIRDNLPHFIIANIGYTKFNFSSKFKPDNFSDSCYYSIEEWASVKNIPMKRNRGYVYHSDKLVNIFVKSKKPWSGQPVEEWVAVEVAQQKLEQIESVRPLLRDKKDKKNLAEARAKLKYAIGILRIYQEDLGLPRNTPEPIPIDET